MNLFKKYFLPFTMAVSMLTTPLVNTTQTIVFADEQLPDSTLTESQIKDAARGYFGKELKSGAYLKEKYRKDSKSIPTGETPQKLSKNAQLIYDMLSNPLNIESMKDGKRIFDLHVDAGVDKEDIKNYAESKSTPNSEADRQLFYDFAAAKDAWDLDHSEVWWVDSSKLCLCLKKDTAGDYVATIEPRMTGNYYVNPKLDKDTVQSMDQALTQTIDNIVLKAHDEAEKLTETDPEGVSNGDRIKAMVRSVHNDIVNSISYRFENDVKVKKGDSEADSHQYYIRTLYGLQSHEGVCEAYSRALQVALTKLDIGCVLVHGIQQSNNEVEMHMWNYINIPANDGTDQWFMTDATFDDPVRYNSDGSLNIDSNTGQDGREREKYLLVGASEVATDWRPSGEVSNGGFEFSYPSLNTQAYAGEQVFYDELSGLVVTVDNADKSEGENASTFWISYDPSKATGNAPVAAQAVNDSPISETGIPDENKDSYGALKSAENGIFFLTKERVSYADGTTYKTDWIYLIDALAMFYYGDGASGWEEEWKAYDEYANDGLRDYPHAFKQTVDHIQYLEFAMTNVKPDGWGTTGDAWKDLVAYREARQRYYDKNTERKETDRDPVNYYGASTDIISKTGEITVGQATYAAPPYISQNPGPNQTQLAEYTYDMKCTWDDILYHPISNRETQNNSDPKDDKGPKYAYNAEHNPTIVDQGITKNPSTEEREKTAKQKVGIRVECYGLDKNNHAALQDLSDSSYDLMDETYKYLQKEPGDGVGVYHVQNVNNSITWIFDDEYCLDKLKDPNHVHDVNKCPIIGVNFKLKPSPMWNDDCMEYRFFVEGVVGSRSYKLPNNGSFFTVQYGECPACWRNRGYDWNLWGKPSLLGNLSDVDLENMSVQQADGSSMSLQALQDEMVVDDLNGRFTLVAEPIKKSDNAAGGNREEYTAIGDALQNAEYQNINSKEEELLQKSLTDTSGELMPSMYEITFTRLCKMILLQNGQSLRMSFGFPEGTNPTDFVFKAYHFIKCNEKNCPKMVNGVVEEGHKHGEIIGVEPVELEVTPQGLVLKCNSFSPFELVAYDADNPEVINALGDQSLNKEKKVVINPGTGGKVSLQSKTAADTTQDNKSKDIDLSYPLNTENLVFEITPDQNFDVDSVLLDGTPLKAESVEGTQNTANKKYTVSIAPKDVEEGKTALLNITFVSSEQKKSDEEKGLVAVAQTIEEPKEHTHDWKEINVAATCSTPGSSGKQCTLCGEMESQLTPTPATGNHTYDKNKGTGLCEVCQTACKHEKFTVDGETIKCETCGYTCQHPENARIFDETTAKVATCTTEGKEADQVCSICKHVVTTGATIHTTSHTYDSETGKCSVCGIEIECDHEGYQAVRPKVEPSCVNEGYTEETYCTRCNKVLVPRKTIEPTGVHTFLPTHPFCVSCGVEPNKDYKAPASGGSNYPSQVGSNTPSTSEPTKEVTKNEDGSTTTTVTDPETGTITETTTDKPDGSTTEKVTDKNGNSTETTTGKAGIEEEKIVTNKQEDTKTTTTKEENGTVSEVVQDAAGEDFKSATVEVGSKAAADAAQANEPVSVVMPKIPADKTDDSVKVEVKLPQEVDSAEIAIPVENANPGTVACIVDENGESIPITDSMLDQNGNLVVPVTGNATIVIKDNSKSFPDMPNYDKTSYPGEGVAYVSARHIFNGNEDGTFGLDGKVTRGMLARVLYNLAGNPSVAGLPTPEGVNVDWYRDASAWAVSNKLMAQGSNFRGDDLLTREQLAMILWRQQGKPTPQGDLSSYSEEDRASISSPEMEKAVRWAVGEKILGRGSSISGQRDGTRGEVANMLYRFLSQVS